MELYTCQKVFYLYFEICSYLDIRHTEICVFLVFSHFGRIFDWVSVWHSRLNHKEVAVYHNGDFGWDFIFMFRDFEYLFFFSFLNFRQCIHSLRYIITYNIFIIAL